MATDWLERARRLHADRPVVDTLAPRWDSEMYLSPAMIALARDLRARGVSRGAIQGELGRYLVDHVGRDSELRRGYLEWWRRSGVTAASTSMLFTGPPSRGWEHVLAGLGRSERLLHHVREEFVKALGPEDVEAAFAAGRRAILYNVQNADLIGDEFGRVDVLYDLGVRAIQLTYNLRNLFGDGCAERRDGGLSRFGVALVEKLNERGVIVDTSHCSDLTLLDALDVSTRPVAVTHAACRALSGHPRVKPDDILRRIGDSGGYVGIVIMPSALVPSGKGATLDDVVRHVRHAIDVAGVGTVGIGSDWGKPYYRAMRWSYDTVAERVRPGAFDWVGWLPEHHFDPNEACEGMETWDMWPNLTARLLQSGLSEASVAGIVGGNFLRFWRDVVG